MPLQLINTGTLANDGTGDTLRTAGQKMNANATELFDAVGALGVGGAAPVQSVAGKTGVVTLAKADVGLGEVDNTADAAKPISTATQEALNLKLTTAPVQSVAGKTGVVTLAKADVGLGAVDNTADAAKPISTATQVALNLRAAAYTESAETTYSTSATILIAHGLGVVPKDWEVVLRCKTADSGYAVGDEVEPNWFVIPDGTTFGSQSFADATNIGIVTTAQGIRMVNKTTRTTSSPISANWRIVARWR